MASIEARTIQHDTTASRSARLFGDLSGSSINHIRAHERHGHENHRTQFGRLRAGPDRTQHSEFITGDCAKNQMAEEQTQIEKERQPPLKSGSDEFRLVALEIRPQKAGFAVFEGSALLDWGVTRYGKAVPASRRIESLLDLHGPSVIVTRWRPRLKHNPTGANVVESIKQGAQSRSIRVRSFDASQIRTFFKQRGCWNKHSTAVLLAEWFPELALRVPPKRKPWQNEPHNALLFDAVAIGVTYLTSLS
jgi:hypothetical protein